MTRIVISILEITKQLPMKANKHITPALVFGLLAVCMSMFSQENPEKKVLFRSEKLTLSNFFVQIAPGTNFSQLNGQMANVGILSGGFILNDKFAISFFSANSPKLNLIRVPEPGSELVQAGLHALE